MSLGHPVGRANLWRVLTLGLAAGIAIAGFLLMRGILTVVLPSGESGGSVASTPPPAVHRPLPPRVLADYESIMRNNPFGRGPAGPLTPLGSAPGTTGREAGGAVSGGPFELAGTVVKENGYRYAVFEKGSGASGNGTQILARVGDDVPGIGRVAEIEPGSVTVESGAGRQTVVVRDVSVLLKRAPAKRTRSRQTRRKSGSSTGDQIQRIGEGTFRLSKEGLKAALKNPQKIMTEARLLPYMKDGSQQGFIVREVKRGGIYEGLGLKNGDILLRVNDLALESPDSALQAFGALQGLDRVRLQIVRRGENRSLVYHIE